ncbi:exported hypothetical protein [uncultured Gammaproteobacteria bacterium]
MIRRSFLCIVAGMAAGAVFAPSLLWRQSAAVAAEARDDWAVKASGGLWLAYVITGDPALDETSRAGLEGLRQTLARRTVTEPLGVLGLDPERDDLAFFPLLYWPVGPVSAPLGPAARSRLNTFISRGGTIIFDTGVATATGTGAGTTGSGALRSLTQGLNIPPLMPIPTDHVLSKAFYLLREFPGRQPTSELWVEAGDDPGRDGVSAVIIGDGDWAAAWAVDDTGTPLHAVIPGGERQREMAYRFGVNLVIYALTGNYKADQVHVPAILERLGQ